LILVVAYGGFDLGRIEKVKRKKRRKNKIENEIESEIC
jgi:hypothetical protein